MSNDTFKFRIGTTPIGDESEYATMNESDFDPIKTRVNESLIRLNFYDKQSSPVEGVVTTTRIKTN